MRKTLYFCDHCAKELGSKDHLSIGFSYNTGVAHKGNNNWTIKQQVSGTHQFCNGKCLGAFFKDKMQIVKDNNK